MRSSIRVALALVTMLMPAAIPEAGAQEVTREIFVTQDADYSGFDLRAEKNISLDDCKKICLEDPACKAFTYNTKVSWCFLKSDFRDATDYKGAIAGRIVETATVTQAPLEPDLGAAPALSILPRGADDEARQFARRAAQFAAAADQSSGQDPMAAMRTAMNNRSYPDSETLALTALGLDPQNVDKYLEFTRMALSFASSNADNSWRMRDLAVAGAVNAYQVSRTASKRAEALALMGKAFEGRSQYRAAIDSYKTSLELVNSPETAGRYRSARSSYGFRITGNTVDADNTAPRACIQFSEALVKSGVDYNNFVTIDGKPGAIEATGSNICVEGLEHGKSYTIALRSGLPSSVAEVLEEPAVFNIYVRDRAPAVRFTGENFVLPGAARQGIPVIGINADKAKLELFRIGDRSIAPLLAQSRFLRQLEGYTLEQMQGEMGTPVWKGELDLERTLNRETVTSLPLDKVMPERKPGIYVLVAQAEGAETDSWEPRATQWFLISDIGLSTYSGIDGLSVFTRSLDTAGPIGGVELTLIARNNEVLGTATSDANGFARFDAGLLRGTAGSAAAVVTARHAGTKGEDYVFLNLERAGFDLSDRGVTGRASPGPVDVYAYLDRGIYRLGETVNAMALARDDSANAQGGLPLTIVFERPDGVEATRIVSSSPSESGHLAQYTLPETGMRGVWKLLAYTDPDAEAVVEKLFLVEDFIPDRIEFDIKTQSAAIAPGSPAMLEVDGRFLYGAPANDLALEGEIRLKAGRTLASAPGYVFGLAEEEDLGAEAVTLTDLPRTGADGKAMIEATLRSLPVSSRPLYADMSLRMREDGGRAVERKLTLPVTPEGVMVGIKPEFADGVVRENSQAGFSVIAIDPQGVKVDQSGLKWTLARIERNYQWYRDGSYWRYEAVEIPRLEQEGTIDVAAGQPGAISVPVTWGQYRLEVSSLDAGGPATSVAFDAGYYVASESAQTPDALEIALDKESYAAGETAKLRVSPRFAGEMLVAVGTDRIVETINVTVPAGGTEMEIPVKGEWGAGAYVTATLFRPGSAQESRMPMRAIGTSWLQVTPGERELKVAMELPQKTTPEQRFSIPLTVIGAKAGEEIFATLAMVDVGILNLTRYEAPDPVSWYFGQRQLGLEIRDIYGNLIDGSQGVFGNVRTGGDGPSLSAEGSPPTEKLLSLFSGIVKLDDEGKAVIEFDIPEFNGTGRVMAVAWTKSAVGHAQADVIIRDPVVITASLPKVMAPGDEAETIVEIANTDGPAGTYELSVAAAGGLEAGDIPASVELAPGERKSLALLLKAVAPGTGQITVTASNGTNALATRTQLVTIRPDTLPITTRMEIPVAANGSITIDQGLIAQNFIAGSSVSVSVSRTPGFDVSALLTNLDRYPYGCAEQTTSRALPLLYLSDLDAPKELVETPDLDKRIDGAVARVLTYQAASGAFGLWGPGDSDMWLDAYVTDFLTRAREKGFDVPEQAMRIALANLQNKLGYTDDVARDGNSIAYALYVLARNRMASAADLRYFGDTKIEEFSSPLARAHIAAALSLYNEVERSSRIYGSALQLAGTNRTHSYTSYDYGSRLRDGAAILALASETRPVPANVADMMRFMQGELQSKKYTSTQEQAWMLLAARATQEMNKDLALEINGEPHQGAFNLTVPGASLATDPVQISNPGSQALVATVTTLASPLQPLPAGGDGFEITREYYTLDGEPADITQAKQNERYVVVLTVNENTEDTARILVTDLLPGGFEIDNPRLVLSADLEEFGWLGETEVAHSEFRSDRFVAALNRQEGSDKSFSLAYVVRAVTPGTYSLPAATVEDMYRPELSARTATGFMQVQAGL